MTRIALTSPSSLPTWKLSQRLLRRGTSTRLLCRSVSRVTPLIELGAQVIRGDLTDPASVNALLDGVDSVCVVTPSAGDPGSSYELRIAQTLATAIAGTGVEHVVYISALGAEHDAPIEALATKRRIEDILGGAGARLTVLRPAILLDILRYVHRGLDRGMLALPMRGDRLFPALAADDVAQAAMRVLHDRDVQGTVHDLVGTMYTPYGMTETLARHWHRPIHYRRMDTDTFRHHLRELGLSERRARVLTALLAAHDTMAIDGDVRSSWSSVCKSLSIQEIGLEAFAAELVGDVHGVGQTVSQVLGWPSTRQADHEACESEMWIA